MPPHYRHCYRTYPINPYVTFMRRRFEPVTSPHLHKMECEKVYKQHMTKVSHIRGIVNSTQPELSPRHRMIAKRAEQRHKTFINRTQSKIRDYTRNAHVPYSDTSARAATARDTMKEETLAGTLFEGPVFRKVPTEMDFLASYHNNESKSRAGGRSAMVKKVEHESDSDDHILDIDLSSDLESDSADASD